MLKSPLPEPPMRAMGLVVAACLAVGAGGLAWAAQPARPAERLPEPAAAIPGNGHLEPAEAARLVGPGQVTDCKPDANRELHNCRILGSPFAKIATAADVQREWPAAAKKAGLTGYVTLRCSPNPAKARLDHCEGYHFGGAAERPEFKAAFEAAAIRVISVIQLKAHPGPNDDVIDRTGFYTIEFNDHPHMPGGPPGNPPVTRFPDFLPGPGGAKTSAQDLPGPAQRAEVERQLALHPDYTCDPELERKGIGCKIIVQSHWLALPTPADVARAYPAEARRIGATAQVVLQCGIARNGLLKACSVLSMDLSARRTTALTPSIRADFGRAALELIRYFQLRTPPGGFPNEGFTQFLIDIPNGVSLGPPKAGSTAGRQLPPLPPVARTPVSYTAPDAVPTRTAAAAAAAFANAPSPNWSRRPTLEDLVKVFPPEAEKARLEGDAVISCHVAMTGKLTDCRVLRETPEGAGFGAAALKLAEFFEARAQTPDGGPKRGSDIRIPFRFRYPNTPVPSAN